MRFAPPPGWIDGRQIHGTTTGYRYGCRCEQCRAANTEQARDGRARRVAALTRVAGQLNHGTKATYVNHGCRCAACVGAQKKANSRRPL